MTETYGDKRSSLIAAGKVRHKVAVIGRHVFGELTADQIELGTADVSFFNEQQFAEMEELRLVLSLPHNGAEATSAAKGSADRPW